MKPECLYKFMAAPRFLEGAMMRFTPPSQLNDPREAVPGLRVGAYAAEDLIEARTEARSRGFGGVSDKELEALFLRPFPARRFDERSFPGLWPASEKRLRDEPFETLAEYDEALAKRAVELFALLANATLGVLSLTEASSDALWAYYAAEGSGVRVGLDANHAFFAGQAQPVLYSEDPISVSVNHGWLRIGGRRLRTEDVLDGHVADVPNDLLFRKRLDWAHEKEWRMVRPLSEADDLSSGIHLFSVPADAFLGLTFGHLASEAAIRSAIERIEASSHWHHLRVNRMARSNAGISLETLR